jgi:hypothetical protein
MKQLRSTLTHTAPGILLFLLLALAPYPMNAQILTTELRQPLAESRDSRDLGDWPNLRDFTRQPPPLPPLPRPDSAAVIANFIAAETRFRETLLQFSFKRDVTLQTLDDGGQVTGEYRRSSSFVLDDSGQRFERVFFHPASSIKSMKITKEDVQDLAGSQLFGLELAEISAYNFTYLGPEKLQGQTVYAIAASPAQEPDPHNMRARFFVGTIWIDAQSFQIVRLQGITEPHGKQRFPAFTTERSHKIAGLLFPAATFADDVLRFPHVSIHYRIAVRYYDFKRFASELKIVEVE